jgi:hypothetical protein
MPNTAGICSGGQTYTIYSELYMTAASSPGQTFEVNYLGYIYDTLPLGSSDSGQYICCFVDPVGCTGYSATCQTSQYGTVPCLCTTVQNWSATANSCPTQAISMCN